ncbi:MAG: hypothetical protein JRF15_06125 [Deltaproteobacteria bacterium]|jgi:hypothetical protein|nr:hypothetical protein [Deltaproteobacteria bacterium]
MTRLNSTPLSLRAVLLSGLLLALCAMAAPASARPETIRAGVSYYSDELIESGPVRDIGTERNYEEVFKLYRYYEVFYDESERVVRCLEYKRGDVIREDTYRYAEDGSLLEHVTDPPRREAKPEASPDSR